MMAVDPTWVCLLAILRTGCLQCWFAPPISMSLKTKTVLITDDDEGMRDTLCAILKRDHKVLLAATGEEALTLLKKEDVDLMLLDVRLPGIGGLEVLKIVRENYSLVEVIMVSAVTEVEVAVQAMKTLHHERIRLRRIALARAQRVGTPKT